MVPDASSTISRQVHSALSWPGATAAAGRTTAWVPGSRQHSEQHYGLKQFGEEHLKHG